MEGSRGGPRTRKTRFWSHCRFSLNAPELIFIWFQRFFEKTLFLKFGSDGFSRGAREGPETCVWPLRNFQGGPRKSGSGPRGPFLGGPGSAKVRQGFNFEVNPGLVLTFSFFALNDFWKVPRGSPERGAEQQQFQRGAEGGGSNSLWGSEAVPKRKVTLGNPQ